MCSTCRCYHTEQSNSLSRFKKHKILSTFTCKYCINTDFKKAKNQYSSLWSCTERANVLLPVLNCSYLASTAQHCQTPHFYTRKRLMHNTVEEEASSKTPFSTPYLKKHYRLHKKALFEQITACTLTGSSPAQPGQPSGLARHLPAFRKSLHLLHRQTILMTLTLPINQLMKQDCFFLTKQCTETKPLEGCLFLPAAGPPK